MQLVINTDHRHKRLIEVAGLMLGIALLLITHGHTDEGSFANNPMHYNFVSAVRSEAVEVPREVVAIAEDIASRFKITKGSALNIVSEAFHAAKAQGLEPTLILAIIAVESHYKTNAVNSVSGAKGLMQVLPKAHKDAVKEAGGEPSMLQVAPNLKVGTAILAQYIGHEDGNLQHALGRYWGSPVVGPYFSRVRQQMYHFEQVLKSHKAS